MCLAYRCIIDRQQKQFDAESCRLLCNFAEVVVQEILKYDARVRLIMHLYKLQSCMKAPGLLYILSVTKAAVSGAEQSVVS